MDTPNPSTGDSLSPLLPFRPLPALDELNRAFWTGGADGRLHLQRCGACGTWLHPALPRCRACLSTELGFHPVSGRGEIHTFTVNHQQWIPGADPYAIVLVQLDEQPGLRVLANLRECDLDDIHIGMRVEVCFEHQGEEHWLPQFRPAGA